MKIFPSKQQWTKWSFVAKSGYVGTVSGVAGVILSVAFYFIPPETPPSPADKVLKDDNPTKIELVQISIEQWLGDSEPFITIHLDNPSKRTALSVSSNFREGSSDLKFSPTKTSTVFQGAGLSIEPGKTLAIPAAPVSEFLSTFKNKCAGCYMLGIGKEAKMPLSLSEEICHPKLESGGGCYTDYTSYPIAVINHFTTVFGDKESDTNIVFAYLSRNAPTRYRVPAN